MPSFGTNNIIMDDLIFHELWLARQRFQDFENETQHREDETDEEEEEDNDVKKLFSKSKADDERGRKQIASIAGNSTSEWMSIVVGVFFVAAVAGIASYQAYKTDFSKTLDKVVVSMNSKSDMLEDTMEDYLRAMPTGIYDEIFLPMKLSPISYLLYLSVHISKRHYTGLVKISLKCHQDTDKIILHSSTTKNKDVLVKDKQNKDIKVLKTEYNWKREMMVISLETNLTAGSEYTLLVSFEKTLKFSSVGGFYLTKYRDGNGKNNVMANTFFEPMSARKAFPCFDEPDKKATFELFIQHDKADGYALSNMPVKQNILLGTTRIETRFEATPLMSTYLFGFAVTNYTAVEEIYRGSIKIRVFAPQGRLAETKLAKEIAPVCVKYYEDNFKINYTLPKLDLVPLTDLAAGADEVWGMNIYQEGSVLYDESVGSPSQFQLVTTTICHEIAHMWFGDLVTMKRWNDLWLKESFAAYLEYLPVAQHYPQLHFGGTIFQDTVDTGLSYDSSIYTHPIQATEPDPKIMEKRYDEITYQKGASVLPMLVNHIGQETFYEGVHKYLYEYKFGNAAAEQFWETISNVTQGLDVVSLMNTWVNQAGYPVVLMKLEENKTKLTIRQDRFVFQNKTVTNISEDFKTIWEIPIDLKMSNEANITKMILKERSVTIDYKNKDGWFKGNFKAKGFFRTYYDRESWQSLLKILDKKHEELSPVDRANLLSDINAFSNYKYMTLDSSLEFTTYLSEERSYIPWSIGIGQIYYIRSLFRETKIKQCVNKYIDKLISPSLEEVVKRTVNETQNEKQLKSLLMAAAVLVKKPPITENLIQLFLQYLVRDGQVEIPGHLLSVVFCAGIKNGQIYEWEDLFKRYKKASSRREQHIILSSLACSKDKNILERYLNMSMNSKQVAAIDRMRVLQYLCLNHHSKSMTWDHVKKSFKTIVQTYSNDPRLVQFVLESCLSSGKTHADLKEAELFMKTEKLEKDVVMLRIVETIKYQIELVKEKDRVMSWFAQRHKINC